MAQVVNRTTVSLEVYGIDAADGLLKRWTLAPGKRTDPTFDCHELRAAEGSNAQIFSSQGWWRIHTDYAFVYLLGNDPFFPEEEESEPFFFARELTLHCVPFLPESETSPPWRRGYERSGPDIVRDSTELSDPGDLQRDPEHQRRGDEGELGPAEGQDFFFYDFGIQVRTRMGRELYITVRLTADPSWFLSDAERGRLEDRAGDGMNQLERWKAKIESVWNDPSIPPASTAEQERLHVECDWVSVDSHYNVDIVPASGNVFRGLVASSTMEWWRISLDDKGNARDHYAISAHEFGHYLGLDDGYVLEAELDYLLKDQRIKDMLDPAKATGDDAQIINNPRNVRRETGWKGTFGKLFTDAEERAAKRLSNGKDQNQGHADLMDETRHEHGAQAVAHVDQELVDAIVGRRLQPLRYTVRHFFQGRE